MFLKEIQKLIWMNLIIYIFILTKPIQGFRATQARDLLNEVYEMNISGGGRWRLRV